MDITQELEETVDLSTEYKGQTIDFTADKFHFFTTLATAFG